MKNKYEMYKDHWLVQSVKNGEAIDHEMFLPKDKDKALALVKELKKEGINAKIVHPSIESF